MPADYISNITLILQQHPNLILLFVFLVALTESLIIIGLIIPGAILMVMFGALIALNAMSFWPTVLCAVLGAVMGDTLSYWLGWRYQQKLMSVWPLSRHPQLIKRANIFFSKHGMKSIVFARFVGPLRPVIPAIAGMTGMPIKIFITANISSALAWAPLYLLPGILFGLSLDIASEFSSKVILFLIILLVAILALLWVLQRLYNFVKPYSENLIAYLLNWSKQHPWAGQMPTAIFDASHPEVKGLSILALIMFTCALVLFIIHSIFVLPFSFDSIDRLVFYSLQSFRSPPFDSLMLLAGNLSNSNFIAVVALISGLLLILKNKLPALWHLLAAIFLPLILSVFLQSNLGETLRQNLNIEFNSLPSMVLVSYIGFLTILFSSGFPYQIQKIIYYFSASFVLLLSLAQVYLALQLFSQVLLGLTISAFWISLLGIAYRRHIQSIGTISYKNTFILLSLLLIYPSWQVSQQQELYKPSENELVMGGNGWLESGWELLPVHRQDIYSKTTSSFNIQWAGNEDTIRSQLKSSGFSKSTNSAIKFANWFLKDVEVQQLPVLPHIHMGAYENIRFSHFDEKMKKLAVIRLWKSSYELRQDALSIPLWFGDISYMERRNNLGLQYLITSKDVPRDLANILQTNKIEIEERLVTDLTSNKTIKLYLLH